MIFGNIHNEMIETQIQTFPVPVRHAIRFLMANDMNAYEAGKYEITPGGIPMILQVIDQSTAPRENLRPEIHRKNIDLQFLASGGPEAACFYSRDILFYKNDPEKEEGKILLTVGSFALYFPWDVHIPAVQAGDAPAAIRKIVIKVPMEACI